MVRKLKILSSTSKEEIEKQYSEFMKKDISLFYIDFDTKYDGSFIHYNVFIDYDDKRNKNELA